MKEFRSRLIYLIIPGVVFLGAIFLAGYNDENESGKLKHMAEHLTTVSLSPPDDLNFAGEVVPLHDMDVKERLDRELIRNIFYHSATILNLKRANRWKDNMTTILKSHGIPEDFFYLCVAESHLTNATSPAGARGFWQFMPATAKLYGLELTDQVDERYDPIKATKAACLYLKDAYKVFGNWTLVAASYNMGVGGIRNAMERQQVGNYYDLYLNSETSAYIFRILAIKAIMQYPERYGFNMSEIGKYHPYASRKVTVKDTTIDLVEFAIANQSNYKSVKLFNPWLMQEKLDAGSGKNYVIEFPLQSSLLVPEDLLVKPDDSNMLDVPTDTSPDREQDLQEE